MSRMIGWGLAVIAIAIGYVSGGWRGIMLALSVVVFWLLLQFFRAVRALRGTSSRPVGHVASAVQLHATLHRHMRLAQILAHTGSLGRALPAERGHERFEWQDAGGDRVIVSLAGGRLAEWSLQRTDAASAADPPL
jgi:uncharacterized protein (DUF58 family)